MDDLPGRGPDTEAGNELERQGPPADAAALAVLSSSMAAEESRDPVDDTMGLVPAELPAGRLRHLRLPRAFTGSSAGRPAVEWRRWRRRATALVMAIALILGFSGAAPLTSGPAHGPSASPVAVASGSATPAATQSPAGSPTGTPVATPSRTAETSMVAIPSQAAPTARITFGDIMLDSLTDAARTVRTFTFVSDGPGIVSAQIVSTSPMETTTLCIAADRDAAECASSATPGFTRPVFTAHSNWTVTLASANEGTPTVDVAFSWPSGRPSIHLDGGRFQGSPNPESLRSLTATFEARTAGQLKLTAAWPPATVAATLTLADTSSDPPVAVDTVAYTAAGSIADGYSHAVAAGRTYTVTLFDESRDTSRPELSATIEFP